MALQLRAGPGQILDGRFLLAEEIGKGGMATIFKAEDLQNPGEPVAVKVPLPIFGSGAGAWSMFQREEEIGRRLDHPYILKFVPHVANTRRRYVVTEYVPGRPLSERLRTDRPLPEPEAFAIASRLCDAIAYLHAMAASEAHCRLRDHHFRGPGRCPGGLVSVPVGLVRTNALSHRHAGRAPLKLKWALIRWCDAEVILGLRTGVVLCTIKYSSIPFRLVRGGSMRERQISLFENQESSPTEIRELVLISRPDRPLTKAQQVFNRRIARVEALRDSLDRETQRLNKALAYYGEHLHPRLQRQTELRKDLVRTLVPFLDDKRLKLKSERKTLRAIVADQIDAIISEEGSLTDDDLLAIFKRIHRIDFSQAEREAMEETASVMEAMFDEVGIKVDFTGFRPDMSEEAFAAKMAEMSEAFEQQTEEGDRGLRGRKRPATKRQLEREERERQAEQLRNKSIATIYKQLAKVLHPDLEPDAARRDRKGVLMQELTTAYHNGDLHTLLRLELEWIHREEGDLQRLTDEKLAIYNQVLKDQADELQREIHELPLHPRYQPIVCMDGPFDLDLRTDGPGEARSLDETIASMEKSLARLRTDAALDEVRGAVHAYSAPF
jgi:hypothetical protein